MLRISQLSVAVGIAAVSGLTFGFVSGKADPQSLGSGRGVAIAPRPPEGVEVRNGRVTGCP